MNKFLKGKFIPSNPSKYVGNASKIVFRSSWELAVFKWLDNCKEVVKWSSETVIVPYIGVDGQPHRYFVDLWIQTANHKKFLVEIKPSNKLSKPRKTKKKKEETYIRQLHEYTTIQLKKAAAESYAKSRGMEYIIWTDKTFNF